MVNNTVKVDTTPSLAAKHGKCIYHYPIFVWSRFLLAHPLQIVSMTPQVVEEMLCLPAAVMALSPAGAGRPARRLPNSVVLE